MLSIREKIFSGEDTFLASSYTNLALTYYNIKEYVTAYSFIQKAVAIWTKVLPKGDPYSEVVLDIKAMIEKAIRGE